MNKEEFIEINKKHVISLSRASHDKGIDGKPVSDQNPSEWAVSLALAPYKDGDVVRLSELEKAIEVAAIQENLDILVNDGMLFETFDEKSGEIVYNLTPKGKEHAERL